MVSGFFIFQVSLSAGREGNKTMSLKQNQKNIVNDALIKEIIEALNSLKYGSVQVTVHDSRIVQIDRSEKSRFDDIWISEKGGGI
jgi:hypothetical protein